MIRLLRKFRHDLFTRRRFGNYLIYAIGEIVLVVAGILIALQINNWNEERKELALEQKLLKALVTDLEATLTDLRTDIRSTQNLMAYTDSLYNSLYYPDSFTGELPYKFPLVRTFQRGALFAKVSAYESLKSAGINIIQNDSLRNWITEFYELTIERIHTVEGLMLMYRDDHLIPILSKKSQVGDNCPACKSLRENMADETNISWIEIDQGDDELKYVLTAFYESLKGQHRRYETMVVEIESLMNDLSNEIR